MGKIHNYLADTNRKIDAFLQKSKLPPLLKNKYVLLVIIVVVAILTTSLLSTDSILNQVPNYVVKRDNFSVSITESGEMRAKNSTAVQSPRIRNLKIVYMIPEGSHVKKGELVAKFDPTEAIQKVQEAESQLEIEMSSKKKVIANHKSAMAKMESSLKSAELSYELSKLNLEQMKFEAQAKQEEAKLQHEKNKLSFAEVKQEYESKQIIQQSEMNEQEIKIQQKRAELNKAKRDLERMDLYANADGMVVYGINWANSGRKLKVGDTPWGGMTIVTLPDLSKMQSSIYVNEVDVSLVKDSQKVVVRLDAFPDSAFSGYVTEIAKIGKEKDGDSQIKVFEVNIDLADTSDILKPGMTTSNKIIINEVPNVLFVPHEAVFTKDGKKIVYVRSGTDYDEVEVVLGDKGEDFVIIKSGVSEGDEVALIDPFDEELQKDNQQDVQLPNS